MPCASGELQQRIFAAGTAWAPLEGEYDQMGKLKRRNGAPSARQTALHSRHAVFVAMAHHRTGGSAGSSDDPSRGKEKLTGRKPREEVFRKDVLHPNAKRYEIWTTCSTPPALTAGSINPRKLYAGSGRKTCQGPPPGPAMISF
jgi:hypothetical protein